jgi:cysteinyl-tRNA synthetase
VSSSQIPQEALALLQHDLDTPKVLALLSSANKEDKRAILDLLGIDLSLYVDQLHTPTPQNVHKLYEQRNEARIKKDWGASDRLRVEIEKLGYVVVDTPDGTIITPKIQA